MIGQIKRLTVNANNWDRALSGYRFGRPLILLDVAGQNANPMVAALDHAGIVWPSVSANFPGKGRAIMQAVPLAFAAPDDNRGPGIRRYWPDGPAGALAVSRGPAHPAHHSDQSTTVATVPHWRHADDTDTGRPDLPRHTGRDCAAAVRNSVRRRPAARRR